MALTQITAPGSEPVTLSDAKNRLRLYADQTNDDALVTMLIAAARRHAEMLCASSLITQQWCLTLDSFPGATGAVKLERGPVQTIDTIEYTAMDGSTQLMAATDYTSVLAMDRAVVSPKFGKIWPIPLPQIGAVRIKYTAGYGGTEVAVPEGIRQWILMRIYTVWQHRDELEMDRGNPAFPPSFVDGMLDPYRLY